MIPLIDQCDPLATIGRLRDIVFAPGHPEHRPHDGAQRGDVTAKTIAGAAPADRGFLHELFCQCFDEACTFRMHGPDLDDRECYLRLLEYPDGVGSAPHMYGALFTLNVWQSTRYFMHPSGRASRTGALSEGFHPGAYPVRHSVEAGPGQTKLVFVANPSRTKVIPEGRGCHTVGEWLDKFGACR